LHNFRQFRGESPVVHIASPVGRPVTVCFGANGAGKTALLNAFSWTLYGKTTSGFLLPDEIVNKGAIREAKPGTVVEGWVELAFEYLENRYLLRRTKRVRRGATENSVTELGEPSTELRWCGPDGEWRNERAPDDVVSRVLPVDLHSYFFFDGERIERIVRQEAREKADIANAAKKLVGLEVLERAIRHVNAARKALEKDLAAVGDAETRALLEEEGKLESRVSSTEARIKELQRNLDGHEALKAEREKRLRALQSVREIQERRDELNSEHEARMESLRGAQSGLAKLVSTRGYSVFLTEACNTYHQVVEGMRMRGELPTGIKRQFVDDLLAGDLCICGRTLDEHADAGARSAVWAWREKAGLADVEERTIRMGGEVRQLEIHREDFWNHFDRYLETARSDKSELAHIQRELEEISEMLRNSPQEEVSSLETELARTNEAIERDKLEKTECGLLIRQMMQRLEVIADEVRKHAAVERKQELAQRRVDACREVSSRLEEAKDRFEMQFRRDLTARIAELFREISYKPYAPRVQSDYSLVLVDTASGLDGPVAASQGESQVLSLCFIGAMIDIARGYQARRERLPGPASATYPLVMDSPFGSLGQTYRRQVADHITKLADQVLVMVTNTQWRGEVENSLVGRIGKSYVLAYYTTKDEFPTESVSLGGKSYELIRRSPRDYEYTVIEEVTLA
jgi:DNA sulfur modification protein DndD